MRCPVCRAENDQGPQCRRCRADLGPLFALEKQRRRALDAAYASLAAGAALRAYALAEGARAMRDDEESRQIGAISALVVGDFQAAWRTYKRQFPESA
jgi:hypothetical protein